MVLSLSLSMYDGELDHGGGGGGVGSPAAAAAVAAVAVAAVAVAAVDNNWLQKRSALRALTVAWLRAMTKADSRQQCNTNQQRDQQKQVVVVVAIATAMAAATTVTRRHDGNAMGTMMDGDGRYNGNVTAMTAMEGATVT